MTGNEKAGVDGDDLVYGVLGDELIVMQRSVAEQRNDAIQLDPIPETWGDVRQLGEPYPEWLYRTMIGSIDPEFSSLEEFRTAYLEDMQADATDEQIMDAFRALPVGQRPPFDDDPVDWELFDFEGSNPFLGGHWFTWPANEMLAWVPAPIQKRYGQRGYAISGEYLTLFAKDEAAIVAEFLAAGYRVERDDSLVAGAMNTVPW